jgi:hypothetical protein
MVAGPCKPSRLWALPSPVALVLGVLIGLSLLPMLKSLLGSQLFSCTCVSLCPQGGAAKGGPRSPGAAFSSFIYPTWPARELPPTVSAWRQARTQA